MPKLEILTVTFPDSVTVTCPKCHQTGVDTSHLYFYPYGYPVGNLVIILHQGEIRGHPTVTVCVMERQ